MCGQDLNMDQDAQGAHAPGYWALAGPSLSICRSEGLPGAADEPVGGPSFKLLGLHGP
jgi:hypothetical protein